MAGRLTGGIIATYKIDNSTITYDATKAGGSDHALGNFSVITGSDNTVSLVTANQRITGELLEVFADLSCSVMVSGPALKGKLGSASGATAGDGLVGDAGDAVNGQTGGYVKNGFSSAGTTRGSVTAASGTAKNSIVTYVL